MYGREISPKKTHMCAQTQRGNEGLGRVGMGSDGCRGMHMHAANAKQGKKSDWWASTTYLERAYMGGKWSQGWCGRHMVVIENLGEWWRIEGCPGILHAPIYK